MSATILNGKIRPVGRKGPSRRLRAEGLLPGIIYGRGETLPVTVAARDIKKILEVKGGVNRILTTKVEGDKKERQVIIKTLDVHPIYDTLLHVDLQELDMDKPLKVNVQLEFVGVAVGVKEQGGKLSINLRSLLIECMPKDIPTVINIPITQMSVGTSWRVKDLHIGENLKALNDPEVVVVAVAMPKVEVEKTGEDVAAEAETSEPAEPAQS